MIAGIFTLVIGIAGLSASILLFWRLRHARSYVPVPGRVIERSVVGVLGSAGRASYGPKVTVVDRSGIGVAIIVGCVGTFLVLVALLIFAMP